MKITNKILNNTLSEQVTTTTIHKPKKQQKFTLKNNKVPMKYARCSYIYMHMYTLHTFNITYMLSEMKMYTIITIKSIN